MFELSYYKSHQSYKHNSLTNHTRLTQQAEYILADVQARFRQHRSTTEHILNCRILMEKHMEQRQVYHNFIDFKKAFDRMCTLPWHDGLWNVMSECGIGNDLIQIIKSPITQQKVLYY